MREPTSEQRWAHFGDTIGSRLQALSWDQGDGHIEDVLV